MATFSPMENNEKWLRVQSLNLWEQTDFRKVLIGLADGYEMILEYPNSETIVWSLNRDDFDQQMTRNYDLYVGQDLKFVENAYQASAELFSAYLVMHGFEVKGSEEEFFYLLSDKFSYSENLYIVASNSVHGFADPEINMGDHILIIEEKNWEEYLGGLDAVWGPGIEPVSFAQLN